MITEIADLFGLDPNVAYLNHGSYGTVPVVVREAQRRWQEVAEANPLRFQRLRRAELVAAARTRAAEFLGVPADESALVRNVSEGTSTVFAGLDLAAGDEIVVSNHGYLAVRIAAEHWATRRGARVVEAAFPLGASDEEVIAAYAAAVTPRTRVVVIDAITSVTATVLPVAGVTAAVDAPVLVDAAHMPGHLASDIAGLGATWWVGNLHKWGHTSRGTALLWTDPTADPLPPMVLSWGMAGPRSTWFDHPGTWDSSAWLVLGDGLDVWDALGGWSRVAAMQQLAGEAQRFLAETWDTSLDGLPAIPAPAMRLVRPPAGLLSSPGDADPLYAVLSDAGVEVAPQWFGEEGFLRVAAGPYTDTADIEKLARTITGVAGRSGTPTAPARTLSTARA